MVDFDLVRKDLESAIKPDLVGCPVYYENVPANYGISETGGKIETWSRLTIRIGGGFSPSIGNTVRYAGVCILSIFVPIDSGTAEVNNLGSKVINAVNNQIFDSVVLGVLSLHLIGESDRWYQGNVEIPFEFNQFI